MSEPTPRIFGPHDALEILAPVHPLLYKAIRTAVSRARDFFDEDHPRDAYLFSTLVRYYARAALQQGATSLSGLSVVPLRNIGTRLTFMGLVLRIWKASDDGYLPPPGVAGTKSIFYDQPFLPGLEQPFGTKLAVLWEADADMDLSELNLVCPRAASSPWRPGEEHWRISIPAPTGVDLASIRFEVGDEDLDLELALEHTSEIDDDEW